jgi:hypothetical protein
MALRFVRMRAPGEAPGLKQRRHAVRNPFDPGGSSFVFDAGIWIIKELTEQEEQFLSEYTNPNDVKLFDIAKSKAEAARIVIRRKQQMAAAKAKAFPAAAVGAEGRIGSDEDILDLVSADAAEARAEEIVHELPEPDKSLVERAERALEKAEAEDEYDREAIDTSVGLLSSYVSHDTAKAAADKFGTKLSWIIPNDPDQLLEVPGIGKRTVDKIKKAVGHAR